MASQDDLEHYEATEAQEVLRLFAAVRPPPATQAPPHFRAAVFERVAQRSARRHRLAWLTEGWAPAWAPALAAGLLLSLGVNVWLGYETFEQHERAAVRPVEQPQVPREGPQLTMRGGVPQHGQPFPATDGGGERELAVALRQRAQAYYQDGRYAQVIPVASAALLLAPDDASAYRNRGLAYDRMGNRTQAIPDLQQAARLADPQAQDLLRTWGITW